MNQGSLLYRLNWSYFFGGITLYLIVFFYWGDSVNYYNILNASSFLSYSYLIWICMNKPEEYFTDKRLLLTVFVYSTLFVALYLLMSYTYSDYVLIFNELDAQLYEKISFRMKDMNIQSAISYLSTILGFDDWGIPFVMAFMLKIIPSKLFVCFCQIVMNVFIAFFLFSISKMLMPRKYGFMATLIYTISSYSVFFMSSMLKEETMTFLVIISFFFFYKYLTNKNPINIILGLGTSLLIIFFRVPLTIFIWIVFAGSLLMWSKSHIKKGLIVFLIFIASGAILGLVQYSSIRYVDNTSAYVYQSTSLFQKIVSSVGALIGPFPSLLQLSSQRVTYKSMYAPGLLYKFFLFFPFWKGFVFCIKSKSIEVAPLFMFSIIEMLALTVVFDGLELRKAMPHLALFILAAFWYISRFDEDTTDDIRKSSYYYWTYLECSFCIWLAFIVTLAWNTMVRVPHL